MIKLKNKEIDLKTVVLTNKIFNEIILLNIRDIDYIHLSMNTTLSSNQIEILFQKEIDNVNINLLRNQNCPKNLVEKFLALNDKIYNIAIAHNQSVDDVILKQLLALNDFDVTLSLEYTQSIKKGL